MLTADSPGLWSIPIMSRNKLKHLTQATEECVGNQQASWGWRKEEGCTSWPSLWVASIPTGRREFGFFLLSCLPLPLSLIRHPASFTRIYEAFPQYESNYYFTFLNTLLRRPHRRHASLQCEEKITLLVYKYMETLVLNMGLRSRHLYGITRRSQKKIYIYGIH